MRRPDLVAIAGDESVRSRLRQVTGEPTTGRPHDVVRASSPPLTPKRLVTRVRRSIPTSPSRAIARLHRPPPLRPTAHSEPPQLSASVLRVPSVVGAGGVRP